MSHILFSIICFQLQTLVHKIFNGINELRNGMLFAHVLIQVYVQIYSIYCRQRRYTLFAGEILEQIDGLTHDKLTYFVRAGYLEPTKIKRGSLYYNDFSGGDLSLVRLAWGYIKTFDMKTRSAFERAREDLNDPQLRLLNEL